MTSAIPAEPVSLARLLTTWHADPMLLIVVVAGIAYAVGVRLLYRRGQRWARPRSVAFATGLLIVAYATTGGLAVYSRALLWVFTVQVLVLLLAAPLLLAFGRPLALLAGVRGDQRRDVRVLRALGNPLVGPALLPLLTAAIFFTRLLDLALRHSLVGFALSVTLVLAGLVLAVPLAGDGALRPPIAVALALLVGFFELLADAIPGIVLRLAPEPVSTYFATLHRGWGPLPLHDQHTAGSVLWMVAEVVDLPFLALLVVQWIRADAREAAALDARLDATEVKVPAAGPSTDDDAPERVRPWWETDASVFGAERAARYGGPRRR